MGNLVHLTENWALMPGPSNYEGGLYSTMIDESIDIDQISESEFESFISSWFASDPETVNTEYQSRKYKLCSSDSLFEITFSNEDQLDGIWICSVFTCCSTVDSFHQFAVKLATMNPNIVLHSPECELIPLNHIPGRYSK